jgi:hypothetical protein
MNLEIIESVIDLIEMGAVRSEDVVKNLRSAIKDTLKQSSTQPQRTEQLKACVYCDQLVGKEKNNGV